MSRREAELQRCFNLGEILRKELVGQGLKILRLVVGNPCEMPLVSR